MVKLNKLGRQEDRIVKGIKNKTEAKQNSILKHQCKVKCKLSHIGNVGIDTAFETLI